ncbi:hypothetical protein OVA19_31690 [Streptomyces sp. SL203]|nr:hypothetical protein [Streptomyces sp. SL203]MCY1655011.1 hypothetical protein [Streptomyces sp. SL203]
MSPYTEGPDAQGPDAVRAVADAAGLEAAGWNSLLGAEDFFQTPRWLAVQEVNSGTAMDFLLRERAGAPVAGLVTAWADTSVAWLLARPDAMLRRALEQEVPEAAGVLRDVAGGDPDRLLPSLVCGGGIWGAPGRSPRRTPPRTTSPRCWTGPRRWRRTGGRRPCASRTSTYGTPR